LLSQLFTPRLSYLPLLLPRLHAFFSSSLIDPTIPPSEGWFSFEDVPLKWHHPIGLLFDLYAGAKEALVAGDVDSGNGLSQNGGVITQLLPWKLTVHFSEWPLDALIKMDSEFLALQDAFNNSVKEVGCSYLRCDRKANSNRRHS
jgi:autophagy-related protein 5